VGIVLDSSVIIAAERRGHTVREILGTQDRLGFCVWATGCRYFASWYSPAMSQPDEEQL
jgi:hypothetical protein